MIINFIDEVELCITGSEVMDVAELALEYVRVIVWPIVGVIGMFLFGTEVRALLRRIRGLDLPGGTSLSFDSADRETVESLEVRGADDPSRVLYGCTQEASHCRDEGTL